MESHRRIDHGGVWTALVEAQAVKVMRRSHLEEKVVTFDDFLQEYDDNQRIKRKGFDLNESGSLEPLAEAVTEYLYPAFIFTRTEGVGLPPW
jgi:hypothetical protein